MASLWPAKEPKEEEEEEQDDRLDSFKADLFDGEQQLSHQQPGWFGLYRGWNPTQLHRGFNKQ